VSARRTPIDLPEWLSIHRGGVPHKVLRDWAVRAFVDQRIRKLGFARLAAECLEQFGAERAPSKSALHRYYEAFHHPFPPIRAKRKRIKRSGDGREARARVKRTPIDLPEWLSSHLPGVPHKVLRDWAVRAFVDQRIRSRTFQQLAAECVERFGAKRAPRKSALHRYWDTFFREGGPQLTVRRRGRKHNRKSPSPRK
jgi:hypothetical protein